MNEDELKKELGKYGPILEGIGPQILDAKKSIDMIPDIRELLVSNDFWKWLPTIYELTNLELERDPTLEEMLEWRDQVIKGYFSRDKLHSYLKRKALKENPGRVINPPPNVEPMPPADLPPDLTNPAGYWRRPDGTRFVPALMMAPRLRHMTDEVMTQTIERCIRNGFNGLHLYIQEDFFDFGATSFEDINTENINDECFVRLNTLAAKLSEKKLWLHFWLWGDVENKSHPSVIFGKNSPTEQSIYARLGLALNRQRNRTSIGYGWDANEFLNLIDVEMWRANMRLVFGNEFPLLIRTKKGEYNDFFPVASLEHIRPTEEDLRRLNEQYPDKPKFSEDRWRATEHPDYDSERHGFNRNITEEEQLVILWNCTFNGGIAGIYGKLPNGGEDIAEYGSLDYRLAAQFRVWRTWHDQHFGNVHQWKLIRDGGTIIERPCIVVNAGEDEYFEHPMPAGWQVPADGLWVIKEEYAV